MIDSRRSEKNISPKTSPGGMDSLTRFSPSEHIRDELICWLTRNYEVGSPIGGFIGFDRKPKMALGGNVGPLEAELPTNFDHCHSQLEWYRDLHINISWQVTVRKPRVILWSLIAKVKLGRFPKSVTNVVFQFELQVSSESTDVQLVLDKKKSCYEY